MNEFNKLYVFYNRYIFIELNCPIFFDIRLEKNYMISFQTLLSFCLFFLFLLVLILNNLTSSDMSDVFCKSS